MSGFILSPVARRDIRQIWRYSFRQWGEPKADAYIRDINHYFVRLSERPDRGKPCDYIRSGYFRANYESHAIFFRLEDEGIFIIRVLHQSMDFDRHL